MLKHAFKLEGKKDRGQYLYLRSSASYKNFLTVEAAMDKLTAGLTLK